MSLATIKLVSTVRAPRVISPEVRAAVADMLDRCFPVRSRLSPVPRKLALRSAARDLPMAIRFAWYWERWRDPNDMLQRSIELVYGRGK